MTHLKTTGLILCLGIAAVFPACSDDEGDGNTEQDSSVRSDAGTDASAARLDASLDATIDSATPVDSATPRDAQPDSAASDAAVPGAVAYTVTLSKTAELPPCANAGASATGIATVSIDESGEAIALTITYSGLSGDVTAGHIHYGDAATASGPVVLPFKGNLKNQPVIQTLTANDYAPKDGTPPTFAAFVSELKAGKAYVNLHTDACKPGEIRGQIQ